MTIANKVATSLRSEANVCLFAAGLAPISNHPWRSPTSGATAATMARSRRRSRLRRVAGPTERPTAKATRSGSAAGSLRKVHHRVSVLTVRPERARVWNARRPRILQIKPTAGCGP